MVSYGFWNANLDRYRVRSFNKLPIDLSPIKTIVIVMMENRSFDHLLGYLSLVPYNRQNVTELQDDASWQSKIASKYNNASYLLFR
jgi:phospholipase C